MNEEAYTLPEFAWRTLGGFGLLIGLVACACKLFGVRDALGIAEVELGTWIIVMVPSFFLFCGMEERKNHREYRKKMAKKTKEASADPIAAE